MRIKILCVVFFLSSLAAIGQLADKTHVCVFMDIGTNYDVENKKVNNEAVIAHKLSDPAQILNYTRDKIIDNLLHDGSFEGGKDGMDCSFMSFDLKNLKVTYAAANISLWIVRATEIIILTADKKPVGKHSHDSIPFNSHTFDLQKGDVVYSLTDGIPDQFDGPKGKKLMNKDLKQTLLGFSHLSMQQQKEELTSIFTSWKGELEQVDDVCVMGVRI